MSKRPKYRIKQIEYSPIGGVKYVVQKLRWFGFYTDMSFYQGFSKYLINEITFCDMTQPKICLINTLHDAKEIIKWLISSKSHCIVFNVNSFGLSQTILYCFYDTEKDKHYGSPSMGCVIEMEKECLKRNQIKTSSLKKITYIDYDGSEHK